MILASYRLRPRPTYSARWRVQPRRHLITGLSEGFLDLALALPYPSSFPPYTSTIVLLSALLRVFIFPVSLWVRGLPQRRNYCDLWMAGAK